MAYGIRAEHDQVHAEIGLANPERNAVLGLLVEHSRRIDRDLRVADAGENLQEVLRQPRRLVGSERTRDQQVAVVALAERGERRHADVRR